MQPAPTVAIGHDRFRVGVQAYSWQHPCQLPPLGLAAPAASGSDSHGPTHHPRPVASSKSRWLDWTFSCRLGLKPPPQRQLLLICHRFCGGCLFPCLSSSAPTDTLSTYFGFNLSRRRYPFMITLCVMVNAAHIGIESSKEAPKFEFSYFCFISQI